MKQHYVVRMINNVSNNNEPVNISGIEDIMKINSSYISLSGYIDFCLQAKKDFEEIKDKEIDYHVILPDSIKIEGYRILFDCLSTIKGDKSINSLEFILRKKVSTKKFEKLIDYITNAEHYFFINFKLGNIEVFTIEQLEILSRINDQNEDVDIFLDINQSYEGCHVENNDNDNSYEFTELIEIKQKVNEIISKIPSNYTDIEKVLFLYKYLGKKVKYDYKMAAQDFFGRKKYDRNSIYDVLIKNKGVCSGIAIALRILINAIGIECKTVSSSTHEWNVVKIDDIWYHMDLTWDLDNIKSNNRLQYFLKSEKFITKDEPHQFYTWYADKNQIAKKSVVYTKYDRK